MKVVLHHLQAAFCAGNNIADNSNRGGKWGEVDGLNNEDEWNPEVQFRLSMDSPSTSK